MAVASHGSHLIFALGDSGLVVVDPAVATGTRLAGLEIPGGCYDLMVAGDLAYLAMGSRGLGVVDFSDDIKPSLIRVVDLPEAVFRLAMDGPRLAASGSRCHLLDLTHPTEPQLAGQFKGAVAPVYLTILGNNLYLAVGDGLEIVDLSRLDFPQLMGRISFPRIALSQLAVRGHHVFVSLPGARGIAVVDVSNPESPKEVARLPASVQSFTLWGSRLVARDPQEGVIAWDVSNPVAAISLGRLSLPNRSVLPGRAAIALDRVWFPAQDGWIPGVGLDPGLGPTVDREVTLDTGWARDLAVDGDRIYVADGAGGLVVLRREGNSILKEIGRFQTNSSMDAVSVSGGRAAILNLGQVSFLDVRDPARISILGDVAGHWYSYGGKPLALSGEHAYLGGGGLSVATLTELPHCTATPVLEMPSACSVSIQRGHLVACANQWVGIYDLQDPARPRIVGQHRAPTLGRVWTMTGLGIAGDFGFVATDSFGLEMVDLRELGMPRSLGNSLPWRHFGQVISHGRSGLGAVDGLLSLLDPTNPADVQVVSPNPEATVTGAFERMGADVVIADGGRGVALRSLPPTEPAFLRMPSPRRVVPEGLGVTLESEVSGSEPLALQWLRNGTPIPGATGERLALSADAVGAGGLYSLVASNGVGRVVGPEVEVRRPVPVNLAESGRLPIATDRLVVAGNLVITIQRGSEIAAYKFSPAGIPGEIWRAPLRAPAVNLSIHENFIHAVGDLLGLVILDLQTGRTIHELTVSGADGIHVAGNWAYLTFGNSGMSSYDLTDPANPISGSFWSYRHWMAAGNDRTLVNVAMNGQVHILDLAHLGWSFPDDFPVRQPLVSLVCGPRWAALSIGPGFGDWPTFTEHGPLLHFIEVAQPAFPRRLGTYDVDVPFRTMAISGEWLYAASERGLRILDLSDPTAPRLVLDHGVNWNPLGIAVQGNRIWVAEGPEGLRWFALNAVVPLRLGLDRLEGGAAALSWPAGLGVTLERSATVDFQQSTEVTAMGIDGSYRLPTDLGESFFRLRQP
ncbi:MAG: hypothetical protein J0L84_06595 [Verrucomicrobia bacterium]|nr:hypothetical protein [Verrucomicrobiota bacterium]